MSKGWVWKAVHISLYYLDKYLARCGLDYWENKATRKSEVARSKIIKDIEGLLRDRFGWNEIKMCKTLLKYIDVDVNEFRKYGIEPCAWLGTWRN
jgi:hypothetical protein